MPIILEQSNRRGKVREGRWKLAAALVAIIIVFLAPAIGFEAAMSTGRYRPIMFHLGSRVIAIGTDNDLEMLRMYPSKTGIQRYGRFPHLGAEEYHLYYHSEDGW